MTYNDLKLFLNSLTEDQLQQEPYLSRVDDSAIKICGAMITQEDEYFDHTEPLGNLENIKKEYPDEWESVIEDANMTPKGLVLLLDEG